MGKEDNIEDYKNNYMIPYGISNDIDPVARKSYEGKPQPNPRRTSIDGEDDHLFSKCRELFWKSDNYRLKIENLMDVEKIEISINSILAPSLVFKDLPNIEELCISVNISEEIDGFFISGIFIKQCPDLSKVDLVINDETVTKFDKCIRWCTLDAQTYYGKFYNNRQNIVEKIKDLHISY